MAQWNAFVNEQNERLARAMAELREEQNRTLNRLMDQLSISMQHKTSVSREGTPKAPPPQYSEIIEEKK